MTAVTDTQVTAYEGLVSKLAKRFAGYSGAEEDDLYQEGMIAVWLTLERGIAVSRDHIRFRMLNWCRYLRKLQNNDGVAYEQLLPMEHHAVDEL